MKRIARQGMLALAALVLLSSNVAVAQDSEITDKDLYNFALVVQVVEQMKAEVGPAIQSLIEEQEGFDGKRYNELKGAGDDEAKLKELGANEFEIKFMGLLVKEQEEKIDNIKSALNTLVKGMVGVQKYKTIKSTLSVDPDLKARYEAILNRIGPAETGA